jgi:hypothetical protein
MGPCEITERSSLACAKGQPALGFTLDVPEKDQASASSKQRTRGQSISLKCVCEQERGHTPSAANRGEMTPRGRTRNSTCFLYFDYFIEALELLRDLFYQDFSPARGAPLLHKNQSRPAIPAAQSVHHKVSASQQLCMTAVKESCRAEVPPIPPY